MNLINIEKVTKSYTERRLFDNASFFVQEKEKIGIVGINGTGKSTLLKIVAGLEEPDEGSVIRANHVVINFLPQNPEFDGEKSVLDHVMEKIITTDMDEAHRWSLESEAKSLMLKLGIYDMEQLCKELSGGQKKRLALVAAVLKPCDVLIMDEPTNHLDYDMVEWLEEFLRAWKGALLMVTHDRYFLDSVCNRIVEVDRGSIYSYDTNYSGFLALKTQREEYARASERKRQSILRKEIEWMQRGARARSTKQKAHIQRYEALRDQEGIKEAQKLELSSLSTRLGRNTIEINNVSKSYGDFVCVKNFTYILLKGDRIGFVGKNGCGKTTLMKMIVGLLEPDSGKIDVGQTVKIGYYGQEIHMNPNERVIDYIKDTAEYVRTEEGLVSASAMLERFLFPPEQQYSPIGKLSGGERRRLNLLRVLMEAPNVMILDEPTNDLDTETLAILEDYLDNYDGIVVTVSHDRYFLDRIAKRIFAFEGDGKITQYEGGYTDYMLKRPQEMGEVSSIGVRQKSFGSDAGKAEAKLDSRETWGHQKKVKFTYKEQKEYETIEGDIEKLENEIAALEEEMGKNASNYGKLNALSKEKEEKEALLLEKMDRWEYLEELAAKIEAGA